MTSTRPPATPIAPPLAQAALASYRKSLHLRKLTGTAQSAAAVSAGRRRGNRSRYALNATVAASDGARAPHGTWSYHSMLVAYQKPNSSLWYIAWAPDVLAPNLTNPPTWRRSRSPRRWPG